MKYFIGLLVIGFAFLMTLPAPKYRYVEKVSAFGDTVYTVQVKGGLQGWTDLQLSRYKTEIEAKKAIAIILDENGTKPYFSAISQKGEE